MKASSCAYSQTVQCLVHVWSVVTCALDVPLPVAFATKPTSERLAS
jgi:hypothetical protein